MANPGISELYPIENVPEPEEEAPAAQAPAAAAQERFHIVVAGDSLYTIARSLLGSGARWGEIFELNRDIITNPRMIRVGWRLRIPA